MRGEQLLDVEGLSILAGPSPRARGAVRWPMGRAAGAGTIPACAGSREYPWPSKRSSRDHPRVRGEQAMRTSARATSSVLPAPAGMVHLDCGGEPVHRGAPRACGDGPRTAVTLAAQDGCSPRLRGWSHADRGRSDQQLVLPAPAGMVPRPLPGNSDSTSAPRACGDGPSGPSRRRASSRCSPRPRGWSRLHVDVRRQGPVLPAPAGMVPGPHADTPMAPRAPRARGGRTKGVALSADWSPVGLSGCSAPLRQSLGSAGTGDSGLLGFRW